jgi:hypothetical protein
MTCLFLLLLAKLKPAMVKNKGGIGCQQHSIFLMSRIPSAGT